MGQTGLGEQLKVSTRRPVRHGAVRVRGRFAYEGRCNCDPAVTIGEPCGMVIQTEGGE